MEVLKVEEDVIKIGSGNTREEDPEWFSDLETNSKSKDEYMYRKSQDRIRGYFYKFRDDLRKSKVYMTSPKCRKIIENCLNFFKNQLKKDGYFGCYFDRRRASSTEFGESESPKKKQKCESNKIIEKISENQSMPLPTYDTSSYCDGTGRFACQGRWAVSDCEFSGQHKINPYLTREARIIFSTWNLDHRSVSFILI